MDLFDLFLPLHIAAGTAALIAGTVNILRKKGDPLHQRVGRIFFYSMMLVGASALLLSVLHPNAFLFIVGVFTIYLVGTAQRYLSLKGLAQGQKPGWIDLSLTLGMLAFGLAFLGYGALLLWQGGSFGVVLLVFGSLALRMVYGDLNNFRGRTKYANTWLLVHLQRMIGGYIAAMTAFLVVNVNDTRIPGFVVWLLPTAVLVPFIVRWSRQLQIPRKS